MLLKTKIFIKKVISFFFIVINKIFPSALDIPINRFIVKNIDNQKIYYLVLGEKSRSRSNIAHNKEIDTTKWIDSFDKNSCFLDIGSNIGIFSIYAAVKKCKVYAFEPSINASYINLINIGKNNLNNRITLYQILLSNSSELISLETTKANNNLDNLHGIREANKLSVSNLNRQDFHANYVIPKYKLDDIDFKINIDYVKIDVDGNEKELLEGSKYFFEKNNIKSVMIELDEKSLDYQNVLLIFKKMNFIKTEMYKNHTRISNKNDKKIYNHYFIKNKNEK